MKHCLLVFAAVLALAIGVPAHAQWIFIDANGDATNNCLSSDVLSSSVTSVSVYIDTNHNKDGSLATCSTGQALTMNSYTFILSAPTGGVTYGTWADNLGFTIVAGGGQAGNDIWVALASGSTPLAPGKYKLGTLPVTITGSPRLEIHTSTSIDGTAITSFGSSCLGAEFDNTMILGRDFFDACGTASGTPTQETTWGKIKQLYR
jgi:hypothetical protein